MPPRPGAVRNRWTAYAGLSATLAAGVILKALAQRPNFYSAAVYLSQSSANLMILCNLVFVTACSGLLLLQKLLYGPLRPIEVEQLYEKAWFAVTETCLAMTIFRGEIGAWFLVMFFSLLAGKVWGWIGEGRVEVLEQQQQNIINGRNARLFHTRLAASLALSVCFDLSMLDYVVGQVLHMARPDMMVMFGFEFAVLSITSLSTAMRYALNLVEIGIVRKQKAQRIEAIRKERVDTAIREVDAQTQPQAEGEISADSDAATQRRTQAAQTAASQPIDEADVEVEGWEGKGRWVFYLDLSTDFFKLVVYLSFFFILLIFYGLPLHIMRDVFLTCRSFIKRIGDFLRYRTATRDMNERYPDASEADIGREDVCIICREEMRPYVPPPQGQAMDPVAQRMRPKKLPCGHVLHFACLRSWLERQQICPTCRATVVPTPQRPGTTGAPGAAAAQGQHPPNDQNRQPRVYQFGPLRIGVGAARGNNMFQELEQQLANLNQRPAQDEGQQQYGFGIRWDGIRRRAQGQRRHVRGSVEDQLNAAERQMQREVDSLQASMGELQALRNVQAQLARIRMARQAQQQPPPTNPAAAHAPPQRPTITTLTGQPQAAPLQAGSDQLPQGLTLPDGWTMMPLHPLQAPPMPGQPGLGFGPIPAGLAQMQAFPMRPPMHQAPVPHLQPQDRTPLSGLNNGQPIGTINDNQPPQPQQRTAAQLVAQPSTNISNQANLTSNGAFPMQRAQTASTPPIQQPTQNRAAQVPSPAQSPASSQARQEPSTSSQRTQIPGIQSAASRLTSSATSNTPSTSRQLQPPSVNGTRTGSPHRPTRSIGSSWGFSGVEKSKEDAEDEDEDTTDSDDDDDENEHKQRQTPGASNGQPVTSSADRQRSAVGKSKSATVEDLEDPD